LLGALNAADGSAENGTARDIAEQVAASGAARGAPFDALQAVVNELILASRRMSRLVRREARAQASRDPEREDRFEKEWRAVESIFYAGEEDDPITPRLDACVAAIEGTCRDIIESRGTLFAIFNRRIT
jgi:hypothetical protein